MPPHNHVDLLIRALRSVDKEITFKKIHFLLDNNKGLSYDDSYFCFFSIFKLFLELC